MKILVLDNYDSFTYNLVHILVKLGYGANTTVARNNRIELDEIEAYDKILLSPGPGIPSEAGIMLDVIRTYGPTKSILGVCLGHQGIAEIYGATLYNMDTVLHGIKGEVDVIDTDERLFKGIPQHFDIGHYHSWSVEPESVNGSLVVTALDSNGLIMGLRHNEYDVRGVQFHPESIMTEYGEEIILNWINS